MNKYEERYNYYMNRRKCQEAAQMNYYEQEYKNFINKRRKTEHDNPTENNKKCTESDEKKDCKS